MVKSTTHTFTIAANTDWHVARADGLGVSGALLQGRYRLAAGGTDGNIDIALITGDTPSTATSATMELSQSLNSQFGNLSVVDPQISQS